MAPSPAFPWPRWSISSSFIFSLHSSFHLLCAAASLPPAASPVPPACLSASGSFVRVPCPCSLRKAAPGVQCPGLLPQGSTDSSSLQPQPRLASPGHRQRRTAQTKPGAEAAGEEGAPAGGVPAQHSSGTNRHASPGDTPASGDKQGHRVGAAQAWKLWQLSTPTRGNIWQSQRVTTSFFRKQTSILPLNSTGSSVVSCKSGAEVLLSPAFG